MNCWAARVRMQRTAAPRSLSRRIRSSALYAAMPPPITRRTRLSLSITPILQGQNTRQNTRYVSQPPYDHPGQEPGNHPQGDGGPAVAARFGGADGGDR